MSITEDTVEIMRLREKIRQLEDGGCKAVLNVRRITAARCEQLIFDCTDEEYAKARDELCRELDAMYLGAGDPDGVGPSAVYAYIIRRHFKLDPFDRPLPWEGD